MKSVGCRIEFQIQREVLGFDDAIPAEKNIHLNNTIKKQKTCTVFLSSYTNTSGSLGLRTRNAVGTRAAGECFHSFFEFSQTFTSVCITR